MHGKGNYLLVKFLNFLPSAPLMEGKWLKVTNPKLQFCSSWNLILASSVHFLNSKNIKVKATENTQLPGYKAPKGFPRIPKKLQSCKDSIRLRDNLILKSKFFIYRAFLCKVLYITFTYKTLSSYDQDQLNIRLSKKE